jgi:hypothetical protein
MRALTILQPWAHAVLHLGKRTENRHWHTPYRGPLLIHAGISRRCLEAEDPADWLEAYGRPLLPDPSTLTFGAVVAVAELFDCVRADPYLPYWMPGVGPDVWAEGPWLWRLRGVRALPRPVPCRGMQKLWVPPTEVVRAVEEQLS